MQKAELAIITSPLFIWFFVKYWGLDIISKNDIKAKLDNV